MAQISLSVHNRSYQVTCDDGQEAHLRALAEYIDRKLGELENSIGQVGEQRLLFMSCLLIADELFDARRQIDGLKAGGQPGGQMPGRAGNAGSGGDEGRASEALEACAERIEAIAARLQEA
ncbi:cell division protein ZapA [Pelagibius sp.]|uniref:cell division protein ZapA n=1 Tax=Pelagibius sp. TaxID=1931238 RepID=UPI003BB0BC7C